MKKKKIETRGRKSSLTEEVVNKLIDAFRNDFTDTEACIYAGISRETFYSSLKKNIVFSDKIASAKQFIFFAAKRNITQQILNAKSVPDSWKLLEKRQKDLYSDRQEHTGKDGDPIKIETIKKEVKDKLDAILE